MGVSTSSGNLGSGRVGVRGRVRVRVRARVRVRVRARARARARFRVRVRVRVCDRVRAPRVLVAVLALLEVLAPRGTLLLDIWG